MTPSEKKTTEQQHTKESLLQAFRGTLAEFLKSKENVISSVRRRVVSFSVLGLQDALNEVYKTFSVIQKYLHDFHPPDITGMSTEEKQTVLELQQKQLDRYTHEHGELCQCYNALRDSDEFLRNTKKSLITIQQSLERVLMLEYKKYVWQCDEDVTVSQLVYQVRFVAINCRQSKRINEIFSINLPSDNNESTDPLRYLDSFIAEPASKRIRNHRSERYDITGTECEREFRKYFDECMPRERRVVIRQSHEELLQLFDEDEEKVEQYYRWTQEIPTYTKYWDTYETFTAYRGRMFYMHPVLKELSSLDLLMSDYSKLLGVPIPRQDIMVIFGKDGLYTNQGKQDDGDYEEGNRTAKKQRKETNMDMIQELLEQECSNSAGLGTPEGLDLETVFISVIPSKASAVATGTLECEFLSYQLNNLISLLRPRVILLCGNKYITFNKRGMLSANEFVPSQWVKTKSRQPQRTFSSVMKDVEIYGDRWHEEYPVYQFKHPISWSEKPFNKGSLVDILRQYVNPILRKRHEEQEQEEEE